MVYSTYDRKATQRFMVGTLNLLMRAASLEMAYAQIKHDPNLIATRRRQWISHFSQIKNKMIAVDKEVVNHYHIQVVTDVKEAGTHHPKGTLSNSDFSNHLYGNLTHKYYWRDWFVLVSETYDSYKLATHACEYNEHNNHGRSIAVASVDKNKRHVGNILTFPMSMRLYITSGHPVGHPRHLCASSNDAYNQLPDVARNHCNTYAAAGVVCTKNTDIHIHASSGRLTSYNPQGANKAFLFG